MEPLYSINEEQISNNLSVIPVVENKGSMKIEIDTDVLFSTNLTNLIQGSVVTYTGQRINDLKIIIQKNSYGNTSLNNKQIEDLWLEKIYKYKDFKDQFLFVDNQIDKDGYLRKFDPVFLCSRKNFFFKPFCPICGNELILCEDDKLLLRYKNTKYSKGSERFLICEHCSEKGREPEIYSFEDISEMIYNLKNFTCNSMKEWSRIPNTEFAIKKFLKDSVSGVGEHLATKFFDQFGLDTISVLRKNPKRLIELSGMSDLKIVKLKGSLKAAFKRTIKINKKWDKPNFPCFSCEEKETCYESLESINDIIEPVAFYPFSMIVYKDDMINGSDYLDAIREKNSLNTLLNKCRFLKSTLLSIENDSVEDLDPEEFIKNIEVKGRGSQNKPYIFFPGLLPKSDETDIKFLISIWFITFLHGENNNSSCGSLLELINEYSVERESIVKNLMAELATPKDLTHTKNLWREIISIGLNGLKSEIDLSDLIYSLEKIEDKIDNLISEVKEDSTEVDVKIKDENDSDGMKYSFLKIEEVYNKSLEAIIKDIVKEFNPDNGMNGHGTSGFLKKLKKYDEFEEKFRKFKNWYESGSYINRFVGEIEKHFDSIEE
ncbi:MAG: hypothetical protein GY760_18400 [Deltaproteobacteria bacterium]|nr:hypothetical protein [Deltaproteobacteria bacterium]